MDERPSGEERFIRLRDRAALSAQLDLPRRTACYWLWLRWLTRTQRHLDWGPIDEEENLGAFRHVS